MKKLYAYTVIAATAITFFVLFLLLSPHLQKKDEKRVLSTTEQTNQPFQVKIKYDNVAILPLPSEAVTFAELNRATSPGKTYPYTLAIPSLNINAPVIVTGLETSGRMAVPNNYKEVGLFNGGVVPGTPGAAIMGAHVDNGGTIPGVFKNLRNLKIGDTLVVKDMFGKILTYRVTKLKIYNKDEPQTNEVFTTPLGSTLSMLNLITCFGTWLPKENTYSDRLVVFTELVA